MTTIQGSCYCGGARFECDLPPRFVAHCHCDNCRRAHGCAYVTWAGFPAGAFRWTSGETSLGRYQTETGATRTFCSTCGSPLTFASPRWAGEVHVAVAHLEGPVGMSPSARVYADRAPDWGRPCDDLPQRGGADGVSPLP